MASYSPGDFALERVLSEDTLGKTISLLCRSTQDTETQAVVVLARQRFPATDAAALLSDGSSWDPSFQNDVYSKYAGTLPPELAQVSVDVICPASSKHISKHEEQEYFMIHESPSDYREVSLPFIEAIPADRTQWVRNILNGQAEAERVVFRDAHASDGFVLLPDMKWDQTDVTGLYCVAISQRADIKCLRDLTPDHLPLLKNISRKGCSAIKERYGVSADRLRIYVHYQPSYYHFHVHFSHMKQLGSGLLAGKAHLLSNIIDILSAGPQPGFYANHRLSFALGARDPLYEAFKKRKAVTSA